MAKKILLIEDSATQAAAIANALGKEGFEVIIAATGEEGVERAAADKPDLVIIDTLLPGIDGFVVCAKIRQNPASKGVKIIVITGSVDAIDAVKARKSGADDFCVKTKDLKALVEAVKRLLPDS
jgi:DNA-binding response OmpR family regulator